MYNKYIYYEIDLSNELIQLKASVIISACWTLLQVRIFLIFSGSDDEGMKAGKGSSFQKIS